MPATQYLSGALVLALSLASAAEQLLLPDGPITIERFEYDYASDEFIYQPVAHGRDWTEKLHASWTAVVIPVPGNPKATTPSPVCEGGMIGKYWDRPPLRKPLDWVVGDDGCRARLAPGPHEAIVTVTPHNGGRPVGAHLTFVVPPPG